jgi:hypothetical protein
MTAMLDQLVHQIPADLEIPVHTAPQTQGDVGFLPAQYAEQPVAPATAPVPPEGVILAAGNNGHIHLLLPDATTCFNPDRTGDLLAIGVLTVAPDTAATIHHDEHGYMGVGPGTYVVGGQQAKIAGVMQRVAD